MYIIRRYWRIVFPIVIAIVIWVFSSQNGDVSDEKSLRIAEFLGISNFAIRKFAHIVLFGAFGYSLCSFIKGLYPSTFPTHNLIAYPIIAVTVYSALDEVHQLTVIGRSAQISDIAIDVAAGIFGILLYVAIFCFWRRFRLHRATKSYAVEPTE